MNKANPPASNNHVAVIIPAYNAEGTLFFTLASAVHESGVAEIIVVNDGSTDRTLQIARQFEPRVKVITGPNCGVSAARNRGIAVTSSQWLIFLDADDQLTQDTVRRRLQVAEASGADVVITGWQDVIDDGAGKLKEGEAHLIDWKALEKAPEIAAASQVWATTAAILYSRRIVTRIGGFRSDLPIIQDARFLFDAIANGAQLARSDHIGAKYRVLPNSLSRAKPALFWEDVLTNGLSIQQEWHRRGLNQSEYMLALHGIFDTAARGLFQAGNARFFEAVDAQSRLGLPLTKHSFVARSLARLIGLPAANALLKSLVDN